jgi:Holliday junction DNA helicase RuvA
VLDGDSATLTRLPGVGKKTAERLVVEMKDRLKEYAEPLPAGTPDSQAPVLDSSPVSDAVNALIALGYKPNEASRMVRSVDAEGLASEDIIRLALKGAVK